MATGNINLSVLGKVLLFTWRQDSVNGDFSIKATIKYHLR